MPIRVYLDSSHKFDGETIRQMGIAFEMALASLRATPDWNDPIRAAFASASSRLRKPASTIPSASVRAPCGRSALLCHSDGRAVRRAVKPPKPEGRRSRRDQTLAVCRPGPEEGQGGERECKAAHQRSPM
jgi:hypothetical protein